MIATGAISFTTLESKAPVGKTFDFKNDKLENIYDPAQHATAYIGRVNLLPTLSAFCDYLSNMTPIMVNTYGLPIQDYGNEPFGVVPKKLIADVIEESDVSIKGAIITRTADNFAFKVQQPGILLIDIDDSANIEADILNLFRAVPLLGQHQYIRQYSSSANIFHNGKLIRPAKGIHLYFAIDDASQIPTIGKIIFDRLVLAGFGKIKISSNGAMLSRSIIDNCVWQAERLDFAGGANLLNDQLTQDRNPMLINPHAASMVQASKFEPITSKERKEVLSAWADLKDENANIAELTASNWIDAATTETQKTARTAFIRSANGKSDLIIQPGFMLISNDGKMFDVADVIDAVKADIHAAHKLWDGMGICDPETEERGKAKLYVNIGRKSININSFKHGGKKYQVVACPVIERTNKDADIQKILDVMKATGKFYVIEESVVRINEQGALDYYHSSDDKSVRKFIHNVSNVHVIYQKNGLDQFTLDFSKFLLDNACKYLPEIARVSNIPGLTDKLEVFGEKAGYDAKTKYYFTTNYDVSGTRSQITSKAQADSAIEYLLTPFKAYRFRHPTEARAALLGAVMTMALRPILHTAPGIMVHTPRGGHSTGKSPLTTALAAISGYEDSVKTWKGKDENEKSVLTHLINSSHKVLKFDNVNDENRFFSDMLASVLTESIYSGRILGVSKEVSVPTNIPVMFSGNNYTPSKDMAVRLIELELIPGPQNISWLPVDKVDRKKFVETVFALVQYCNLNFDIIKTRTTIKEIKFAHWSRVVQSPVIILTGIDPLEMSYSRGKEADYDEMWEITAILDDAIMKNGGNDIIKGPISMFNRNDNLCEALNKKCRKTEFARAFASFAKEVGQPMKYGEFILERVGDRASGHDMTRYTLRRVDNAIQTAKVSGNFGQLT